VREISEKGEGSGLGAAGGAVVGGVLGHQVGGGSGKQIATVVGAVGGAVVGNEVEKRVKATKSYDITVRLDDGSTRVVNEANPTSWRTGDRVRIVDGEIRAI
jgi:outer membrane lipoprotein SlyB